MVGLSEKRSKTLASKIYNAIGFSKGYNFILWFIFAGALFGFTLARLMYLDFNNYFCPPNPKGGDSAAPGECYYYTNFTRDKVGIILHLAGILPGSILACIQFTPIIRHKWIWIHRISGYLAILLYVVSLVGALMIAHMAFGGGMEVQVWVGFVGIGVLVCLILSLINIKRLQIEQHRAWMLRAWFYAGSIVTTRMIMIIAATIISNKGRYIAWSCAKLAHTLSADTEFITAYPACASFADGSNLEQVSAVLADMDGATGANAGAALDLNFGMATWLATSIHAIGVEIYLHLTPKEAQRLRQVSYARQLEAGMNKPGSAGLTSDRLGDAESWISETNEGSSRVPRGLINVTPAHK